MDFNVSPAAAAFASTLRQWASARPSGAPRPSGFDAAAWRALADLGLLSAVLPALAGGQAAGAADLVSAMEALGQGGADRGLLFALGAHLFGCAVPLTRHGRAEQIAAWAGSLASGAVVGALAVTEPGGGSSFAGLRTTAVKDKDGYRLHGTKTLVCNAPQAGLFVILASESAERGPFGLTAFLVPSDTPGLTVSPILPTAGLPGAPMGEVRMDGCAVPDSALLGRPGSGLKVFMTAMGWERGCLLAGALGAAQRELTLCATALRQRGVAQHQAVSHRLARVKMRLDTARLTLWHAAWSLDNGREDPSLYAAAKISISEALVACATDMVTVLAGQGWRGEPFDAAGALADTMGGLFASGTTEALLDLIGRTLQNSGRRA